MRGYRNGFTFKFGEVVLEISAPKKGDLVDRTWRGTAYVLEMAHEKEFCLFSCPIFWE